MRRLAALLCLLATPLSAQTVLPWLHDVTGVAANDELHIRQAPSASAPAIGALPPDARDVEVIAADPSGNCRTVSNRTAGGSARSKTPSVPQAATASASVGCTMGTAKSAASASAVSRWTSKTPATGSPILR